MNLICHTDTQHQYVYFWCFLALTLLEHENKEMMRPIDVVWIELNAIRDKCSSSVLLQSRFFFP